MPSVPSSKLVLCFDPDTVGRRIRCAILESAGYRVTSAGDLAEAARAVERATPDAVLFDAGHEADGGVRLADELRRLLPNSAIVMLVTRAQPIPNAVDATVPRLEGPGNWLNRIESLLEMSGRAVVVLNVDDNEGQRYAVSHVLRKAGFEVLEAGTAHDAIELAHRPPDLILLDVNLPDMNGFEVCRILKEDPATARIPVVHISATFRDKPSELKGRSGGAEGYLLHPIDPDLLVETVRRVARQTRSIRKQD